MVKNVPEFDSNSCAHSYEELEAAIREQLTHTRLSYREIAAIVGWSHTQLWSFHKQNCKLQFEVLDRLALLFKEPYLLTHYITDTTVPIYRSVDEIVVAVREALTKATTEGISYRKIGDKTNISHEWVRCFHVKEATIEVRKLLLLASFVEVPYELSNANSLARKSS